MRLDVSQPTIDTTSQARNAEPQPSIVKPGTSFATNAITTALINNRNKPRVRTVNGSVNRISKGRTIAFATARIKLAIRTVGPYC